MHTATTALLIGLGGAAGAVARWALGVGIQSKALHPHFPVHTFVINLLGCLAIGAAIGCWGEHKLLKPLLIIGFLGGFTTFSTFGFETFDLIRSGRVGIAAIYVGLSAALGVLLVWVGMKATG